MIAPSLAPVVTRFAPSPTGGLHLGHVFSAWFAWDRARWAGGRYFVRIEDIDVTRCRPEFERAILDDLAWLGLASDGPVRRQSEHMADYAAALARLDRAGLIYPCFCTRADIRAEIERAGGAPQGPDGPVYPGICRRLDPTSRALRRAAGEPHALRLDMASACRQAGPLVWSDRGVGAVTATPGTFGDIVLARKEMPTSYHLAVTVDDAIQGVTLVTRGRDLFAASHVHRLLQALLGLPAPDYHHHDLVADPMGERLAKRTGATTIAALRAAGRSAADVKRLAAIPDGDRADR
jgi:glutamyl-Q tRNA(Asp) synthetase